MNLLKHKAIVCLSAFGLLLMAGCDSSDESGSDKVIDLAPTLANIGPNVIVATYADLANEAAGLLTSVEALAAGTTDPNLRIAQSAWVATRAPWEASEGFLFGPVDQYGLDPSLDTWPVDEVIIQSILDGSDDITEDYVANQDVDSGLKGFHVIEFLMYGKDGDKSAASFSQRELEYLVAAARVLDADASLLHSSWSPSGENFLVNVTDAGGSNSQFVSRKDAVLTLSDALIGIADEVGAGKMQGPLDEGVVQVESRFSGNSKNDFQNNIRSIRNIYLGDYGSNTGTGLTDIANQLDSALDAKVQNEITVAIDAIGAIPGAFREAIATDRASVETAIDAVLNLKTTLEQLNARFESDL